MRTNEFCASEASVGWKTMSAWPYMFAVSVVFGIESEAEMYTL